MHNHPIGSAVARSLFRKAGKTRLAAVVSVSLLMPACIGLAYLAFFVGGDDMGNFLNLEGWAQAVPYRFSGFALVHLLNAAIMLYSLWRFWLRRHLSNGKLLVILFSATFVWVACAAFEAAAIPVAHKIVWYTLEFLGVQGSVIAMTIFAFEFGPGSDKISPRALRILVVTNLAMFLLVATNSWHGQVWTSFVQVSVGAVKYGHGPAYVLVMGHNYLLFLIGWVRFLQVVLRLPPHFRKMGIEILVGTAFVPVTNLVHHLELSPVGLNVSALGFSLMAISISVSLLGSRLLGVLPIVREVLGDSLREVVLVFDEQRRLVDFSPAAYRLMEGHLAIGMGVDAFEGPWRGIRGLVSASGDAMVELAASRNRWYEARSSVVQAGASSPVRGAMVILYDVSLRKEREQRERDTVG